MNDKQKQNSKALVLPDSEESPLKGITHPKKRKFLENFQEFGNISNTSDASGVGRTTVHYWINNDAVFLAAFDKVKDVTNQALLDKHLTNIRNIAFDPKEKSGIRLLGSFFEVKKLDPTYRERQVVDHRIIGDIIIHSAVPEPDYGGTPPDYVDSTATEVKETESATAKS